MQGLFDKRDKGGKQMTEKKKSKKKRVSRVNKYISPGTPDKMAEESVSIDLTGLRKPD